MTKKQHGISFAAFYLFVYQYFTTIYFCKCINVKY